MDLAAGHVDLDRVPGLHFLTEPCTLDHRESEIDRVPEENAGERIREDRADPERLQRNRSLLPARAASEVGSRDDNVSGLDSFRPRRIHGFERVLREYLRVRRPEILARDDMIRGDVVAERPHPALEAGLHRAFESDRRPASRAGCGRSATTSPRIISSRASISGRRTRRYSRSTRSKPWIRRGRKESRPETLSSREPTSDAARAGSKLRLR